MYMYAKCAANKINTNDLATAENDWHSGGHSGKMGDIPSEISNLIYAIKLDIVGSCELANTGSRWIQI